MALHRKRPPRRTRGLHRRHRRHLLRQQTTGAVVWALMTGTAVAWGAPIAHGPDVAAQTVNSPVKPVGTRSISVEGQFAYRVPGLVAGGTTYMPIWYVQQVLRRIGFANTWNGREWDIALHGPPRGAGFRPSAASADREIVLDGQSLYRVKSIVYHGTTFMPIWYISQLLKRVGDTSSWSNPVWNIVLGPGQHYRYPTLDGNAGERTVSLNGHAVFQATGIVHGGTTYLPLPTLSQTLDDLGLANSTANPSQWDIRTQGNAQADGATAPMSGEYAIMFNGQTPLNVPCFVYQNQTYLPIYYVSKVLQSAGLTTSWDGWTWNVAQPGGAADTAASPIVFGFVTNYGNTMTSLRDAQAHQGQLDQLATFDHVVEPNGQLTGAAPASILSYALSQQLPVYATITNLSGKGFSGTAMATVLQSPTRSALLQQNILQRLQTGGYTGAVLDIEQLPPADRAKYAAFVTTLAASLHSAGKKLDVLVPPDTSARGEPWNAAYDYAQIGAAADKVILMAYDESYPGGPAGPIAPVPWVKRVLTYATQQIAANKLLLGIDAYGYDWSSNGTKALSLDTVDKLIAREQIVPSWDAKDEAPYFTYTDSHQVKHTVYYENAQSTAAKLALARQDGVAGISVWHMGLENQGMWNAVLNYIHP